MENSTAIRAIPVKSGQAARCIRSKKKVSRKRTEVHASDGFLRHRFRPLMDADNPLSEVRWDLHQLQDALDTMGKEYGYKAVSLTDMHFPKNISMALRQAKYEIRKKEPEVSPAMVMNKDGLSFITFREYGTGNTLYYLPVRKLWLLYGKKGKRNIACLLRSVFSYLFQIAGMPYFTEPYTYLCYQYEMYLEYRMCYDEEDGDDESGMEDLIDEYGQLQYAGKKILKDIRSRKELDALEKRIASFKPRDDWESKMHELAKECYRLYCDYPTWSLASRIVEGMIEPDEEDRISLNEYFSFVWDTESGTFESIMSYINMDFQERGIIDQPLAMRSYDRSGANGSHDLDFEERLFDIIWRLSEIL